MEVIFQQIINGLSLGMMYALLALGFTMVYGIIELINFSHFSVFVAGAFISMFVLEALGLTNRSPALSNEMLIWILPLTLLATMISTGFLGIFIERICLRPLRGFSSITPMITTIGLSFIITNVLMLVRGPNVLAYPNAIPDIRWNLLGATYQLREFLLWTIAVLLMVGLHILIKQTILGKAMRATAADAEAAQMMGIEVNQVIALAFFIGSALAGAAGFMHGLYYRQISFAMGFMAGMRAFTAAVVGGIGNVVGAMLGGIIIGLIEALGGHFIAVKWVDVIVFSILILTFVFKPTGLMGRLREHRA